MDEQMEIKKAVGSTLASSQNKTKNKKRSKLKDAHKKTSMMWPSQNFLPYNGTIIKIKVNEWINI